MNWEKIENHLFDKYCVEGEDKELCNLQIEHDKEIRNKVIDDMKSAWDNRVKDLIKWCKDKRLSGLEQADLIFDEIAEEMRGAEKDEEN